MDEVQRSINLFEPLLPPLEEKRKNKPAENTILKYGMPKMLLIKIVKKNFGPT